MTVIYCIGEPGETASFTGIALKDGALTVPVSCENWNRDLSPWPAEKVFPKGEDFSGGADAFLKELSEHVIPQTENSLGVMPDKRYLMGYSLAGLFALYAALKTDLFDGVASVSGSLWFDGFLKYVSEFDLKDARLKRAYFSVGDREKNAKEPRMQTVEDSTRQMAELLRDKGIQTYFELNPGGHFKDIPQRMQKGLLWLSSSF